MASVVARRTLAARLPDLSRATLRNTQTKGGVRQMSGGSYEEEMGKYFKQRKRTKKAVACGSATFFIARLVPEQQCNFKAYSHCKQSLR